MVLELITVEPHTTILAMNYMTTYFYHLLSVGRVVVYKI